MIVIHETTIQLNYVKMPLIFDLQIRRTVTSPSC